MADTNANELVLRCQFESWMEVEVDGAKKFYLIGEGFTAFPIALNPQEYSRKYVNYKTQKTDVIGYAPSVAYSCDCISNDTVVQDIVKLTDQEALGTATNRRIVHVNTWEENEGGKCPAYCRTFAIVPAGKGDGTDAMVYTGTMRAASDQVYGLFDRSAGTFTEGTAAAASTNTEQQTS